MKRIRLIHWNDAERAERARKLRALGYAVDASALGPPELKSLRRRPPDVFVIDLGRLPSHGREVAIALRVTAVTRTIPIVFAGGAPEKVAGVKRHVPDAVYAEWPAMGAALARALKNPPAPVRRSSVFAAYAGVPLVNKLGIAAGTRVRLAGAPRGFEKTIGSIPEGARVSRSARPADLALWFVDSVETIERGLAGEIARLGAAGLWIVWKKQAAGGTLTQADVRRVGLAAGLVDYKVCAIDATWTGLRFRKRK